MVRTCMTCTVTAISYARASATSFAPFCATLGRTSGLDINPAAAITPPLLGAGGTTIIARGAVRRTQKWIPVHGPHGTVEQFYIAFYEHVADSAMHNRDTGAASTSS